MTEDIADFGYLETIAGELLDKLVKKRDSDATVTHTQRVALHMISEQTKNVKMWISAMSSDEFDRLKKINTDKPKDDEPDDENDGIEQPEVV